MKVYHILPAKAYDAFMKDGCLRGDGRRVCSNFRDPYKWLVGEMRKRLPPPPKGIRYPIWVWKQWSKEYPCPDLRSRGHLPSGTRGVRLTLDIPEENVLLSDFHGWRFVLNRSYLAKTEVEFDSIDPVVDHWSKKVFSTECPDEYRQKVMKSWEYIFDFTTPRDPDWDGEEFPSDIQGTTWELRRDQVKKVTPFIAR